MSELLKKKKKNQVVDRINIEKYSGFFTENKTPSFFSFPNFTYRFLLDDI